MPVEGPSPAQSLRYSTLDHFVRDFLIEALWSTSPPPRDLVPQWLRHAGAIVRLEALSRTPSRICARPGIGMSSRLHDHADSHLAILMDPNGPFKGCSATVGHDAARDRFISADPPPAGFLSEDD